MEIIRHKDLVDKPKGRYNSPGGMAGIKKHKHNTSAKPTPPTMEHVKVIRASGKTTWIWRTIEKK